MKKNFSKKGIILVEAIIALSALTIASVAIFQLMAGSLRLTRSTADETIATYLAVEGMELVKQMLRQNYYDDVESWRKNITGDRGNDLRLCLQFDYRLNHNRKDSRTGEAGLYNLPNSDDFAPPNRISTGNGCRSGDPDNLRSNSFFNEEKLDKNYVENHYVPLWYHDGSNNEPPGYTYDTSSGSPTKFRRMIAINSGNPINSDCPDGANTRCKMQVISAVTWTDAKGGRRYVAEEAYYFDWVTECLNRKDDDGDGFRDFDGAGLGDSDSECIDGGGNADPFDNDESR